MLLGVLLFLVSNTVANVTYPLDAFVLESPGAPHDGAYYFVHYDTRNDTVWLLNPLQYYGDMLSSSILQSYNFVSNQWSDHSANNTVSFYSWAESFTSIGSILYLVNDKAVFGTVDVSTLTVLFPHPTIELFYAGTNEPCITNDGRHIFVIGGEDIINKPPKEKIYLQIYDTKNNQWLNGLNSNIPFLNIPRKAHTCEYYDEYLYSFGGTSVDGLIDSIEYLYVGSGDALLSTVVSQSWVVSTYKISPKCRHSTSIICSERFIYIFGGRFLLSGEYTFYDNIQVFDTSNKRLYNASFKMNTARCGASAICTGDYIYVMFGLGDGKNGAEMLTTWEKSNLLSTDNTVDNQTNAPSEIPSNAVSDIPTIAPSDISTSAPSNIPIINPSSNPTSAPSNVVTTKETNDPLQLPTSSPIYAPSDILTDFPTMFPLEIFTSMNPTNTISDFPSIIPSVKDDTTNPTIGATIDVNGDSAEVQEDDDDEDDDDAHDGKEANTYSDILLILSIVGSVIILICVVSVYVYLRRKQQVPSEVELEDYVTSASDKKDDHEQNEKENEGDLQTTNNWNKRDRKVSEGIVAHRCSQQLHEEGIVSGVSKQPNLLNPAVVFNVSAIMHGSAVMTKKGNANTNTADEENQDEGSDEDSEDLSAEGLYEVHQTTKGDTEYI